LGKTHTGRGKREDARHIKYEHSHSQTTDEKSETTNMI
jgi:hypothetical protein